MNNLHKTIFNLINLSLHQSSGAEFKLPENIDWDQVFEELSDQSILGIPLEYMVKNVDAPEETKKRWTVMVYSQVAEWTKLMEEQTKMIELLKANDIQVAIIKGSAAAMNYPKPDYRSMGDVDFFVKAEDFGKTYQLMLDNGYTYAADEYQAETHAENEKYHHVELKKGDILFELHRRMSDTIQGKDTDQKIEKLIQDGMNHIEMAEVGAYEFPMFEKKLNGLIILRHIIQHVGDKGVGLRHVIDWMEFVEKNVDDEFWNSEMAEYLEQVKLKEAAIVFARIGQMYLGMDESIQWCKNVAKPSTLREATNQTASDLDELCKAWMEEILQSGNFGKKIDAGEGTEVLYKNKNIFTMIGSLQRLGMEHWEAARKHRALRPLAWAYQAGRYARKGLGRKNPVKSLKQDMDKSKYKKDLMEKLKIN